MLSEKVLFALNNVNDASLEQARRLLDRSVVSQRQAGRKIIRTFLIAAILAALMAATAYAIVSIHQKRQQELRESLFLFAVNRKSRPLPEIFMSNRLLRQ